MVRQTAANTVKETDDEKENAMKAEDYHITPMQEQICAASFTDCTGLIPAGTVEEKDLAAYRELYPFGAPEENEERCRHGEKEQK